MDVHLATYHLHLLKKKISFTFPLKKPDLLSNYIQFVNRSNWTPTKYSVICIMHFEDKFIFYGKEKRKKLRWSLNPAPTIHSKAALEKLSMLPATSTSQNPQKKNISGR